MVIHPYIPKKKKSKPNAKQRALQASWQELLKKYEPKKPLPNKVSVRKEQKTYIRETPHYPSLNSGFHDTTKKQQQTYTGDKMLGIGTLHKSNAVPVFSQEDAMEISRMRRG